MDRQGVSRVPYVLVAVLAVGAISLFAFMSLASAGTSVGEKHRVDPAKHRSGASKRAERRHARKHRHTPLPTPMPVPIPTPLPVPIPVPPVIGPPGENPGAPVAAIWQAPRAVQVKKPVTLDGSASTGEGPLTCTWSFQNASGSVVFASRGGCLISFNFESVGTKYVELSVEDVSGDSAASVKSFPVVEGSTPPVKEPPAEEPPIEEPPAEEPPAEEPPIEEPPVSEPPSGSQTSHCFASPHLCGYPDPTNTGVTAGTALTASGPITASSAGQRIVGKEVAGSINVTANNVTIENTRVTLNIGSCGPTNTCGNYDIRIDEGVTGTVIRNVETRAASGITCEHDIRNTSDAVVTISGSDLHACDSNIYGDASVSDTYGIGKLAISTDHVENVYFDDGTFSANHVTLLNPIGQTAVIFGNVGGGSGGACQNHLSVKNSLLAGGGYTIYPCGNGTSAGSSSTVITGNHFARCGTKAVSGGGGTSVCQGGADANGYYPVSGDYGLEAYGFGGTWSANVWDDTLAPVCASGSAGCA